jgi:CheY-like chemotaxis protein
MARIRLIHWNQSEGRERQLRLASLGHHAEFDALDGPGALRVLRERPPDAFLIDLSRLPSHGRETALALGSFKDTRQIPLVFVDGEAEKVARIKALLPDATYTTWGRLRTALPRAIAKRPANPVVPKHPVSDKPTSAKLGIKPGHRVCVLGSPKGFASAVKAPPRTTFTARVDSSCDVFLVFLRSARDLATPFGALGKAIDRQPLWLAWPKKASGVASDLDGNRVREAGLAAGWVDYKVCSIDATWSGLAFKRRVR